MLRFLTTKFKCIILLITTLLFIVNARLFFQQLIHKLFKRILQLFEQLVIGSMDMKTRPIYKSIELHKRHYTSTDLFVVFQILDLCA